MTDIYGLALDAAAELPMAELHGVTAGLSMAEAPVDVVAEALRHIYPDGQIGDPEIVESFVDAVQGDLVEDDYSFAPLLPDDDESIAARLQGLSDWVGGYLRGLSVTLAQGGAPDGLDEVLEDFNAIADVDTEVGGGESAEDQYMQLVEYVRAGVFLVKASLDAGFDAAEDFE